MKNLTATICLTLAVLLGSAGVSFALPECEGSPTEDQRFSINWDGCKGTRIYPDGKKYSGEYKSGRPNGKGIFLDKNGYRFDGKFMGGSPEGKFTVTKPDGCVVTGVFKRGQLDGEYKAVIPGRNLPRCAKAEYNQICFDTWKNHYGDTYVGEHRKKCARGILCTSEWLGEGIYTCVGKDCRMFPGKKQLCGIFQRFKYLGTKEEYAQVLAKKKEEEKRKAERQEAKKREEVRREALKREAQEKAAKEAKKPKNQLKESYKQYMMVKECHKTNVMYIGYSQMKSAKSSIKKIEKYYKSKDKKINANAVWQIASKEFDKSMGGSFALMKMAGTYNQEINGLCRLTHMGLTSFRVPGAKKTIRKKDF